MRIFSNTTITCLEGVHIAQAGWTHRTPHAITMDKPVRPHTLCLSVVGMCVWVPERAQRARRKNAFCALRPVNTFSHLVTKISFEPDLYKHRGETYLHRGSRVPQEAGRPTKFPGKAPARPHGIGARLFHGCGDHLGGPFAQPRWSCWGATAAWLLRQRLCALLTTRTTCIGEIASTLRAMFLWHSLY
jgi:hypothetical protein